MLRGGGYDKTLFSYAPSIGGTSMQQNFIFFPSLCSSYEGGGREVARLKATTRVKQTLTPPTIGAFFYLTRNPNRHFLSVGVLLEKFRSLKCHQQSNLTKEARCCWYFGYSPPPVAEQLWCHQFLQQLRPSKEYRYNSSNSGPGDLKNGSHLPAPRCDNNCSGFFRPDAPDRAFNRR